MTVPDPVTPFNVDEVQEAKPVESLINTYPVAAPDVILICPNVAPVDFNKPVCKLEYELILTLPITIELSFVWIIAKTIARNLSV